MNKYLLVRNVQLFLCCYILFYVFMAYRTLIPNNALYRGFYINVCSSTRTCTRSKYHTK